jgi:MATE family multidrug resistance protein
MATLELLAIPIVQLMGATGELVGPAVTYLRIRALAGPAVLFITAGHGIFRGYQNTRTPLTVTLALNGVNLVLDPLLIFGLGWGLAGAAWATVIAQWTGAVWFLWLVLGKRRVELGVERTWPRLKDLLSFLRIGGELATRTLALIGTMTLATAIATRVGTVAVAAHQVAGQLWLLLALMIDALAVAGQAMVAQYRGRGDEVAARAASNRLLVWGLGTGAVLGLAFLALRPLLPRLFTEDPTVLTAVDSVLPFVIWMQPLNALVFVWDGIFLGSERFRYLALQMGVSAVAGGVVLLLVLPLGWGLQGVWWGMVALMVTRAVTLAIEYYGPRMKPGPTADEFDPDHL